MSFTDFLNGNNASNNPNRMNMQSTISCSFPAYQALHIDNMSILISFLKLAVHLMPASSPSDYQDTNIFETPGLNDARLAIIKLIYMTGVSVRTVDVFRFNREFVCTGAPERCW